MKLNTKTNVEDLRGVFFIVKGQYRHNIEPSFYNKATESTQHIGGYDPSRSDSKEWYMVLDCIDFNCIACGSNFDKVSESIYKAITHYRTKERYLKTHRKVQGSKVSPPSRCLYQAVYDHFGDYYSEYVEKLEDKAYGNVTFKTPVQRSKDIKKKIGVKKLVSQTPNTTEEKVIKTLKKKSRPKRSLKKLSV